MMAPLRLAVLISGNGSNLQAIIDAIEAGELNAEIKAVISNDRSAYGLVRATRHGLHTWVVDHHDFDDREHFDAALQHYLENVNPDFIVLAGFMRILGHRFIQAFADRILNIHPSLLPAYKGLNTHQRVLDNNESEHGISVHLVTAELDDGPVIAQSSFAVEAGDTVEDLQQRGHWLEHKIYPRVLRWLAAKELYIEQGRIFFEREPLDQPIRFQP